MMSADLTIICQTKPLKIREPIPKLMTKSPSLPSTASPMPLSPSPVQNRLTPTTASPLNQRRVSPATAAKPFFNTTQGRSGVLSQPTVLLRTTSTSPNLASIAVGKDTNANTKASVSASGGKDVSKGLVRRNSAGDGGKVAKLLQKYQSQL